VPFDPAQGHPEPACGELVESVERMNLSNGQAGFLHRSPDDIIVRD
jgi:hypothetical protein